jgi:DNA-directed RNA polymerase specialized sigma24 family protein
MRSRPSLKHLHWGDLGAAEDLAQDALHATWQAWDRGSIDRPDSWAAGLPLLTIAGAGRRVGSVR